MKCALILIAAMLTCGAAQAQGLIQGNAEQGAQKSAVCAACHGAKGNSKSAQFPKLAGQNAVYLYAQLKAFQSGKRKNAIMQGMTTNLTHQQMKNLAVYFSRQEMTIGAANPKQVKEGRKLFLGGDTETSIPACAACHGPTGSGNPAAGYPRLSGQHAEYTASQLNAFRAGTRSGTTHAKIMVGVASHLTDKQIAAVASYLQGLHSGTSTPDGGSSGNGTE